MLQSSSGANVAATAVKFSYNTVPTGSISGLKFNDLNRNGRFDSGEPSLSNFQIYLDLNNNGQVDSGEPSTRTDSNGNFTFANLSPGTYNLKEVQQSGFVQTTANPSITVAVGQNVKGDRIIRSAIAGTIKQRKPARRAGAGVAQPSDRKV